MEGATAGEVPRGPHRGPGSRSTNLRDLLKVRDDDGSPSGAAVGYRNGTRTLATVLVCEKQAVSSTSAAPATEPAASGGRTLLDVIRLDDDAGRLAPPAAVAVRPGPPQHRIGWKTFRSLLRLRRAAAWSNPSSSAAAAGEEGGTGDPSPSGNAGLNWSLAIRERVEAREPQVGLEEPIRVSLMALLEEADRGGGGPSFAAALMGVAGREEAEEEERGGGRWGTYVCCVCMVRNKGAAFIPCGHTFCRLCSRELWVSRGNCPLCNGFILEILDIF